MNACTIEGLLLIFFFAGQREGRWFYLGMDGWMNGWVGGMDWDGWDGRTQ